MPEKVQPCKLYNNKHMIVSIQITNTEIFVFIAVQVFKLLSRKVLLTNRKDNNFFLEVRQITAKLWIVGMRNFQDSFETRKRSFISAFSICMTVPLSNHIFLIQ